MPHYYKLGKLPHKRHTQFRDENNKLYQEQLFGTEGFSSNSSLLYHCHPPTQIIKADTPYDVAPKLLPTQNLIPRKLIGFNIKPEHDFLNSRKYVLVNNDVKIGLAAPLSGSVDYFYKNADSDEMLFIHEGTGTVHTCYGEIKFGYGDYVIIPRGTIYQITFDTENNRILFLESASPIHYPKRYMSKFGQLLEHSPFCERDIRTPENLKTINEQGDFLIKVKKQNFIHPIHYLNHPFDVVGWDGFEYPFAFNIADFEPITGRVHQPPPVHQNFEANNYVICSFVPRLFDYHPLSIPAPYHHSNIDSDEVLYYVDGDFMSRNNVSKGMITLHPAGIPHGPHPGTIEKSIGAKETLELAVMIDTFYPLHMTTDAASIEDASYLRSWVE